MCAKTTQNSISLQSDTAQSGLRVMRKKGNNQQYQRKCAENSVQSLHASISGHFEVLRVINIQFSPDRAVFT